MNALSAPRALRAALGLAALLAGLWFAAAGARAATVTVAPGDTLGAIAARSGTSVAALARANGIADPDVVTAGRRLTIPGAGTAAPAASGAAYRVRPGDSLGTIAARHGTSVAALASANGITDPDLVAAGRRLVIPGGASAGTGRTAAGSAAGSHTVRPGDTLGALAARHGTTVAALAALNGIADPAVIAVGRVLTIPGARPAAPSATPTSSAQVASLIGRHAARYGVDPGLARAIAWQESGWTQSARSSAGAIGVMQLMPETARWLGSSVVGRRLDPHRLEDNIEGGVAYLAWLRRRAGARVAVGGYYQGLASMQQRGPYDDTKRYVANVLSLVGRI